MTAKRLALLVYVTCALGCLSEQPIVPGSPEPTSGLVGQWRCGDLEEEDYAILSIAKQGRGIRAVFSAVDPKETTVWTAYAVTFEGETLLNVRWEGKGDGTPWTVAQPTLSRPTVLNIAYAKWDNDTFKGAKTLAETREAFRRGYKAKTLFDDNMTCTRL